jgi:hypothetical protein
VFGADTKLGGDALQTLLMVVMRNATTDSPWPLSNNPRAKYNDRLTRTDCNLDLPLWQLVRASTAAPVYFPPEVITVGANRFVFVDGGVTMYNNPAFLLFLMATLAPYQVQWPTGEERMLLVSVGTGASAAANADLEPVDLNLLSNASNVPTALMYAALNEQDMLCRAFGRCREGDQLDREIRALRDADGEGLPKLFTYMRYTADLTEKWLTAAGLPGIDPVNVRRMDSVQFVGDLQAIGRAVATRVSPDHFAGFA